VGDGGEWIQAGCGRGGRNGGNLGIWNVQPTGFVTRLNQSCKRGKMTPWFWGATGKWSCHLKERKAGRRTSLGVDFRKGHEKFKIPAGYLSGHGPGGGIWLESGRGWKSLP
jgi:hypothetical protein